MLQYVRLNQCMSSLFYNSLTHVALSAGERVTVGPVVIGALVGLTIRSSDECIEEAFPPDG